MLVEDVCVKEKSVHHNLVQSERKRLFKVLNWIQRIPGSIISRSGNDDHEMEKAMSYVDKLCMNHTTLSDGRPLIFSTKEENWHTNGD